MYHVMYDVTYGLGLETWEHVHVELFVTGWPPPLLSTRSLMLRLPVGSLALLAAVARCLTAAAGS